jgi:antitoxin VapB
VALNIKDPVTEQLAAEVAELASETKTGAIRVALMERKERLVARAAERAGRTSRLQRFLAEEAWPQVPADLLGQPISRAEREGMLGYGPDGV